MTSSFFMSLFLISNIVLTISPFNVLIRQGICSDIKLVKNGLFSIKTVQTEYSKNNLSDQ